MSTTPFEDVDPDELARSLAEKRKKFEEEQDNLPREYAIEEFLYDTTQNAFWNIATGKLIQAVGVDRCFERDLWRVVVDPTTGRERQQRPSDTVGSRRLTVVDDSTWAPGYPTVIKGMMMGPGGLEKLRGGRLYNAYRAPKIDAPKKGTPDVWLNLVRFLFPEQAEFFIDCCAHMVQHPEEKLGTGFVLSGGQGTGKDTIIWPLKYAVGIGNTASVGPDALFDKFNHWGKSVLLNINEMRCAEKEHHASTMYNIMKGLTDTNQRSIVINEKNQKQYTAVSVARVFITTNEPGAMFLPEEDRRWLIMQTDFVRAETKPYTDAFYAEYNRIGEDLLRTIHQYLSRRDISKFNPAAEPPVTSAKRAMFENYGIDPETLAGKSLAVLRKENDGALPATLFARHLIDASKEVTKMDEFESRPMTARVADFVLRKVGYTQVAPPAGRSEWRPADPKAVKELVRAVQGYRLPSMPIDKAKELLQEQIEKLSGVAKSSEKVVKMRPKDAF